MDTGGSLVADHLAISRQGRPVDRARFAQALSRAVSTRELAASLADPRGESLRLRPGQLDPEAWAALLWHAREAVHLLQTSPRFWPPALERFTLPRQRIYRLLLTSLGFSIRAFETLPAPAEADPATFPEAEAMRDLAAEAQRLLAQSKRSPRWWNRMRMPGAQIDAAIAEAIAHMRRQLEGVCHPMSPVTRQAWDHFLWHAAEAGRARSGGSSARSTLRFTAVALEQLGLALQGLHEGSSAPGPEPKP